MVAAFLGAGCVNFAREAAPERCYDLSVTVPEAGARRLADTRLKIARFQISPRFAGPGLIYRVSDQEWQSDPYERFFLAPERAIEEEMRRWLTAQRLFDTVLAPGATLEATHRLEVLITELFCDYRDAQKPVAVLGIQGFILEESSLGPRLAFSEEYRVRRALEARAQPEAIVAGLEAALNEALVRLGADLAEKLPEPVPTPSQEPSSSPDSP